MSREQVTAPEFHLDHIQILSECPAELAGFYADATQSSVRKIDDGQWLSEGPSRRLLIDAGPTKLGFGAYVCADESALDALRSRITDQQIEIQRSISPLFADRDCFAVTDPDDNRIEFSVSGTAPELKTPATLAGRLQHLVVASTDIESLLPFYTDGLGFKLSDRVQDNAQNPTACFFRSDSEHHSFAIFAAAESRLDHHSYEVNDWNDIRDWADHLADIGVELAWGPGRHGPGNNLFLMFDDLDGNKVEVSAEIEIIHDGRSAGLWEHTERTLNLWGRGLLRK